MALKTKTLLIEIPIENFTKDLKLRYLLVSTIENRNFGEVIEETSSLSTLEVVIKVSHNKKVEVDLKNLLSSLGFNNCNITMISIDD